MFRLSNNLIGILNVVTFLLSIPILWAGVWLSNKGVTECEKFLDKPVIILGVFLMVVSLAGLIGACCRVSWLLWVYLVVMFLLIVLLFCFTIFAFVVTNKGAGEVVSDKGYKEYRLGDYSNWLQKRVNGTKNWNKIRSCLVDSKVCTKFAEKYVSDAAEQFYSQHLSSVQSGCCKPSSDCKFTHEGPMNWNKTNGVYKNPDCSKWENTVDILCYNCLSCKAGVIDQVRGDCIGLSIANAIVLGLVIIFYVIGCCACCNNMNRKNRAYVYNPYHNPYYYRGVPGGPPGGPSGPRGPYP
ncbi:hypothetical protein ACOSQ2_012951 [Xanthoceras sorbifolium]